jgi:hypothetical protein
MVPVWDNMGIDGKLSPFMGIGKYNMEKNPKKMFEIV